MDLKYILNPDKLSPQEIGDIGVPTISGTSNQRHEQLVAPPSQSQLQLQHQHQQQQHQHRLQQSPPLHPYQHPSQAFPGPNSSTQTSQTASSRNGEQNSSPSFRFQNTK